MLSPILASHPKFESNWTSINFRGVPSGFVLSNTNIGQIEMPNRDGFLLPDPRPDIMNTQGNPCMKNCQVSTKIIGRARDIDVTPEDDNS